MIPYKSSKYLGKPPANHFLQLASVKAIFVSWVSLAKTPQPSYGTGNTENTTKALLHMDVLPKDERLNIWQEANKHKMWLNVEITNKIII